MSNLQPNCCLKFDFQKVDQHAGGKWLIHDTKCRKDNHLQSRKRPCRISKLSSYRCDIKGSDSTMLNPIFWKKVQGQKHPGRWGIVEHQIPSIKVLFKTNTKGHMHPSIRLLSKRKTQLVNQRKQKVISRRGLGYAGKRGLCLPQAPEFNVSINCYMHGSQNLIFFKIDYIELKRILCLNPLAQLTVLLALGNEICRALISVWKNDRKCKYI